MDDHIYSVAEVVEALPRLNGQTVTLRGVLTVRREDHSISDHAAKEVINARMPRLWVYFHHATLGTRECDLAQFNGQQVVATGTLDQSLKGHFNACDGTFTIRSLSPQQPASA